MERENPIIQKAEEERDNSNNGGSSSSMLYAVFTLFCALCISAVAAYYSIAGLIAIFSGAALSIAIMGGVLEVGKLVTASWLYNNWKVAPFLLKSYLSVATVVLMLITSMGIFGYLSKAHLAQLNPIGDVAGKVEKLEFQISQEQKKIDRANHILSQYDAAQDEFIKRGYVTRALKQRNEQKAEIEGLQKEIKDASEQIDVFSAQKFDVQKDLRGFEAEVGPLKYIAQFIYGESAVSGDLLDKTVGMVILCLIFVFDPLAVLLVIAGNMSIKEARKNKTKKKKKEESELLPQVSPELPVPAPVSLSKPRLEQEAPRIPPEPEPLKTPPEEELTQPINDIQPTKEETVPDVSIDKVMDNAIEEATKKIPFNISGQTADSFKRALIKSIKSGLKQ